MYPPNALTRQKGAVLSLALSLISRPGQSHRDGANGVIGINVQSCRLTAGLGGVEHHFHLATAARRDRASATVVDLRKGILIGSSDADAVISDGCRTVIRRSHHTRSTLGAYLLLAEVQAGRRDLDDRPAAGKFDHLWFRRSTVNNSDQTLMHAGGLWPKHCIDYTACPGTKAGAACCAIAQTELAGNLD